MIPPGVLGASVVGTSAVRVRIPFRRPFVTAAGTWLERDGWIVRLHAADGRVGVGEASLDPAADSADLDALAAAVRSYVADDTDPVGVALKGAIAAAALDLGLVALDADTDAPAPTPAPAPAPTVAVNATIATEDLAASVADARAAVERGFTTLKLKGGLERSTSELVTRLAAVRDAVGPGVALRLDVNGAWDPATARDRLWGLAAIRLAYVEQPIPAGDPAALARLRTASPIPLAADESVVSLAAARSLLAAGAVDVLVVKPGRVGGPVVALAIAREAEAAGVDVTISTLLETGVGLTAALRVAACLPDRAHGLATADVLASDLLTTPLEVRAGRMTVPVAGTLELDEAALDRFAIERIERIGLGRTVRIGTER